MKFRWIGDNGFKDLDLVIFKILTPQDVLFTGRIIEIPDNQTHLINRIKLNGNYEEYVEPPKKVLKPRKSKKKDKEEEQKEE